MYIPTSGSSASNALHFVDSLLDLMDADAQKSCGPTTLLYRTQETLSLFVCTTSRAEEGQDREEHGQWTRGRGGQREKDGGLLQAHEKRRYRSQGERGEEQATR